MDKQPRTLEFDMMRGVAILLVLLSHTTYNFMRVNAFNALMFSNACLQTICHMAVPIFLLVSGAALSRRYYDNFAAGEFYRKRVQKIVAPYLLWSAIYLVAAGFSEGWPGPTEWLGKLFLAGAAKHLWFFRLIVEIYLFFPWIIACHKYFAGRGRETALLATVLFLQIAARLFLTYSWNHPFAPFFTILEFGFYFMLGVTVGRHYSEVKSALAALLESRTRRIYLGLLLAGFILCNSLPPVRGFAELGRYADLPFDFFWYMFLVEPMLYLTGMIAVYALIRRMLRKKGWETALLYETGRCSFGIFLIHVLFLKVWIKIFERVGLGPADFLFYPAVFLGTYAVSLAAVRGLNRTPLSPWLIGLPMGMLLNGRARASSMDHWVAAPSR